MTQFDSLGFTWDTAALAMPLPCREIKKPVFMLRKLMAQYVYDLVHLEGNPLSFVEVQTLLDGMSVGGQRMSDLLQVLNQHKSLLFLQEALANPALWPWDQALACALHKRIAREEARRWGEFRGGTVRISGTLYQPPAAAELPDLYQQGIAMLAAIPAPFERALAYFFWGALRQFFYDGNKRCARAMMNHALMAHGYYYLSVSAAKRDEFDQIMVDFYDSKNATAGMCWMLACYENWD